MTKLILLEIRNTQTWLELVAKTKNRCVINIPMCM